MNSRWVFVGLAIAMLAGGCRREQSTENHQGSVMMHMVHIAAGNGLQLDYATTTPLGELITITQFAYYISHIVLIPVEGSPVALPVEYFLVNEKQPDSKTIRYMAPSGTYKGLELMIGVDSTRNVSGVQSGALDPANGMFWSWNTGYIFAKLEGKSPVSTAPLQNVTYHIGGFKQVENAIQIVKLDFDFTTPLVVKEGGQSHIEISANIDAWFNAVQPVSIASEPFCMNPGALAQKISANYAKMFTVESVTN